jgi:hypothetical protein
MVDAPDARLLRQPNFPLAKKRAVVSVLLQRQ